MPNQMLIRIDDEVKARFEKMARSEGKSMSLKLRELIEEYVSDHDISSYIDDLWGRIGSDLKSKKIIEKDIQKAIKASRKSR
jgi:predicted DNA-binding protein